MQEFLHVAKCTSVNRGNKLISSSLLFIRNEELVNELGKVANSGYEGMLYLNAAQSSSHTHFTSFYEIGI